MIHYFFIRKADGKERTCTIEAPSVYEATRMLSEIRANEPTPEDAVFTIKGTVRRTSSTGVTFFGARTEEALGKLRREFDENVDNAGASEHVAPKRVRRRKPARSSDVTGGDVDAPREGVDKSD